MLKERQGFMSSTDQKDHCAYVLLRHSNAHIGFHKQLKIIITTSAVEEEGVTQEQSDWEFKHNFALLS